MISTVGDDGLLKIWESPSNDSMDSTKRAIQVYEHDCPITSVAFSHSGQEIYFGALDNTIHTYSLRTQSLISESSLRGHTSTPTSLSISPSGSFLLSPSLNSTLIIHDIRPFSPSPTRIHRSLTGYTSGFENPLLRAAWSKDDGGSRVAVGGADRTVTVWNVESGAVEYKLPGHKGTVMCVDFHPREPISE